MAIDASDILSAWMQGSRFVSQNLQEAEERQQKDEERRMSSLAMRFDAMTSPKIVNGQIQPPDWNAVLNDPEMIAFANSEYMRPFRTQGIQGGDFKISGVQQTEPGKFAVVGQRVDEDGNPVGQAGAPITLARTANNDDPVFTLDPDSAYRFIIGGIARSNPGIAKELHGRQMDRALGVAAMQFNKAKSPEEQQELLNSVGQWFTPDQVIRAASGGLKFKENLATGTLDVESPNGSTTSIPSADIAAKSNQVAGLRAQQNIAAQDAGREAELGFNERTLSRRTGLHNKEVSATVPHDTQVQAQAGLSVAPTVGRAEGTRQVAADNVTRPHEQSTTLSENTGEYQALHDAVTKPSMENDRKLLQFYKPEQIANAKAQFRTDTLAPQMFKNSDAVQAVTDTTGIYASTPDPTARKRLRGMAVNALSSSDPVEQAKGWETLQRFDLVDKGLDAFGSKGAGEKVKMPKFYPDEVKHFAFATDELTDQQRGEAGVEMRRTFDSTLKTLAEAGVPAATLKATEGDLGKATALDYRLRSTKEVSNTAPTLYVAMQMAKKHDAKDLTEEDLALRVVGPLKKMLDEQGVSGSRVLFEAIEDTYRLRGAGVGLDRAVDEAAKMTDPKYTQGLLVTLGKKYPKEVAAAKDAANRGQKGAVLEAIATLRARSIKEEPGLNQRGGELVKQYFPAYAKTVEDMYGWGSKGLRAAEGGARAARIIPGGESPGGLMVNRPNPVVDAINR